MKLTSEAGEITVDFGVAGNWTFSEMSLSKVQYTLNICFRLLLLLDDCRQHSVLDSNIVYYYCIAAVLTAVY